MQTEMKNHSFYEQRGVGAAGGEVGGGVTRQRAMTSLRPQNVWQKRIRVWSGATSKGGENS